MKNFLNIKTYLNLVNKKSNFFHSTSNKVIDKNKDEFKGIPINNLLDQNQKCIVTENVEKVNTAKRVNISIEFKEYEIVLFNKKLERPKMKRIQSKLHKIGACDVCIISLSCFDNKRYISNDGITTLAYFHKDLKD